MRESSCGAWGPVCVALAMTGCAAGTPAAAPVRSEPQVTVPQPEPPAPAPVETDARAIPHVRLEAGHLLLDEVELSSEREPGKLHRIDALFRALKARRQKGELPTPYTLEVADAVDGFRLKSAFQTAAFSGWGLAALKTGGKSVVLHAFVPLPPGNAEVTPALLGDQHLVFVVRSDEVELWRAAPRETKSEAVGSTPAAEVGRAGGSKARDELLAMLESECANELGCSPALLLVAGDAPFSMVRVAVDALSAASGPSRRAAAFQLTAKEPGPPGLPPDVPKLVTNVSGRLPAPVIQGVVRENHDKFRRCYELGLGRDPTLTGKVVVRFVIGRDGRVASAQPGGTIDLKDQEVVRCTLEAVKTLVFPQPEGGIVTVVYPIVFEPGPQ